MDASTVNLLHVLIVILILISIITSAMTFLEVKKLEEEIKTIKEVVIPQIPEESLQTEEQQFAQDFENKLYAHKEISSLRGSQVTGGKLDETTLTILQQQFPEVYQDAKPGNYLLRYDTHLIVYNYEDDDLVKVVPLK